MLGDAARHGQRRAASGLSFLSHFTFKIDNSSGKLVMSRIDQPDKPGPRTASRPEPRKKSAESRTQRGWQRPVGGPRAGRREPRCRAADRAIAEAGRRSVATRSHASITARSTLALLGLEAGIDQESHQTLRSTRRDCENLVPCAPAGEAKSPAWKLWTWGNVAHPGRRERHDALYAVTQMSRRSGRALCQPRQGRLRLPTFCRLSMASFASLSTWKSNIPAMMKSAPFR